MVYRKLQQVYNNTIEVCRKGTRSDYMESTLKVGMVNQVQENDLIYKQGQLLQSIALLLKGTVTLYQEGYKMVLGPGNFIGIHDLYTGKYSFNCEANEPCSLYIFKAGNLADLSDIAALNKDYKGYMIRSLNRIISNINDEYYSLKASTNEIYEEAREVILKYRSTVAKSGGEVQLVNSFQRLTQYEKNLPVKEEWVEGIKELLQVPGDVVANYYSYLPNLCIKEQEEKIKVATILIEHTNQLVAYLSELNDSLFNSGNDCIFKVLCQEVMLLAPSHAYYNDMTDLVDKTVNLVSKIDTIYEESMGKSNSANHAMMEKIYYAMLEEKDVSNLIKSDNGLNNDSILRECKNSLDQILAYGKVEEELGNHFKERINQFCALEDKYLISDETRALRREISKDFYDIYEKVFKVAYSTEKYSKVVEMFLNFGYVDERLLTKEQLTELFKFNVTSTSTHYCYCHTMFEWLKLIYEGKKEPSKNDLDMDYAAYVRHLRSEGKLTTAEEAKYNQDINRKLSYEIHNMFALNMRLVNGKISTFVPVLHSDILPLNMEKHFVTYTAVDEAVRDVTMKDFSLFYREVLYNDPSLEVAKELVMIEHLPDVIIFPTSGVNGSMWQDIEGKRRESSGRFCISIFHEGSLYDTMIKLAARYRWELCRTMQGLAWNDIKNKCLTSEYCDYIQFYRKNKDLNEEKKEKIKQQIIKARNNTRECFVIDYEQWIQYESDGALRLNKPTRDIMAMYCPFSKDIRKNLVSRPVFGEALVRYERLCHNRLRILEAKALAITKKGKTVPKEIADTIYYFDKR